MQRKSYLLASNYLGLLKPNRLVVFAGPLSLCANGRATYMAITELKENSQPLF